MTQTLQSILVATDLSPRSDRALARAIHLARAHKAALTVLSIIDDALPADLAKVTLDRSEETLAAQVAEHAKGVKTTLRLDTGHPAGALIEAIEQAAPDLLVLGNHRDKGLFGIFRETTAQTVVRHTSCPVLIAKGPAEHDHTHILAATDFSPGSSAAVRAARRIAPGARITPLHAIQIPYGGRMSGMPDVYDTLDTAYRAEAETEAKAWAAALGLEMDAVEVRSGGVYPALTHMVEQGKGDLICVGAHGRVGAARALLGSLASDLMRDPPCDLVIARP